MFMFQKNIFKKPIENRFQLLALFVVLMGIVFRITIFVQDRNLIIDEANVVRNIYERGFIELLQPLKYEQYAPPLYLWSLELFSHLFGYSEQAMRLSALLCGIAAIFVFWRVLRRILPENSLWLPLGLFCFAPIIIKYSAEVKQYVPDAFVAICLVGLAISTDIFAQSRKRFLTTWLLAGSIAIWSSQPSVFILASVGFYYFFQMVVKKEWRLISLLAIIATVWLAQFAVYFELILKSQINSDYLQNYHREYFLFATPANAEEWKHNWMRILEILNNTVGYNTYSWHAAIVLILIGAVRLLRKSLAKFALFTFPVLLTLLAAALNQFSLIERVIVFILPFTMLLVGLGFTQLVSISWKWVQAPILLFGFFILKEYNFSSLFREKFAFQEFTSGMDYIMSKNGTGKELYVDCATVDDYIYYTEIHPSREKYRSLYGAYLFKWADTNFDEVASKIETPRSFFIFTGGGDGARNKVVDVVKRYHNETDYFEYAICYVFTFQKK
jgi:4-amino-4-deoxy-L-arabinose transferase-like glycosyltransferase